MITITLSLIDLGIGMNIGLNTHTTIKTRQTIKNSWFWNDTNDGDDWNTASVSTLLLTEDIHL